MRISVLLDSFEEMRRPQNDCGFVGEISQNRCSPPGKTGFYNNFTTLPGFPSQAGLWQRMGFPTIVSGNLARGTPSPDTCPISLSVF